MPTFLVCYIAAHGAFHGHKCEATDHYGALDHARKYARLPAGQWEQITVFEVNPDLSRDNFLTEYRRHNY